MVELVMIFFYHLKRGTHTENLKPHQLLSTLEQHILSGLGRGFTG